MNKLEFPSPKNILSQDWLKLAQWFWRRRFLKFHRCIFVFLVMVSPWKRAWPFTWTNLNSLHPRMLCLVDIGLVVLETKIFNNFVNLVLLFRNCLPFELTWIPFTQGCFVPSLVEIGPVVLEKRMKMWKVYRQTYRQMDGQTTMIRKAHFSYQLR